MYKPAHFREERPEALFAAIDAAGLATIVTHDGDGGFEANSVPLLLDPVENALIGHVAKANPLARLTGQPALAIFSGPDCYISPSWYPSKAETGRVVPTWNYVVVHVHGRLEIFEDDSRLRDILERLTARHEAGQPSPWAMKDAPGDFITAQMKAVVGLRLSIERIEGKAKLSQNRSAADRAGVVDGLRRHGGPHQVATAKAMEEKSRS